MSKTYSQIYLHIVFSVRNRQYLIDRRWKDELYKYLTAIVQNQNHKLIIINGMPDHIHMLIGLKPNSNISHLVRELKANSSKWINSKKLTPSKFIWQEGYGAFSIGHSQLPKTINYIKNQERHHMKKNFMAEYKQFLDAYMVDYEARYLG